MSDTKTLKPSSSYHLTLPAEVAEQFDDRVSSFWLDGKPLLLQLSSYIREKGPQVAARVRLRERMAKQPQEWNIWKSKLHPDIAVDQATAEFMDQKGIFWVHSYLVWPHLTVYATVSGPEKEVRDKNNWAVRALKSLALVTH